MNLKNRTLSTEIDYYQDIEYFKFFLRHFKTLSPFSKLILLILFIYFFVVVFFLFVGLLGFVVEAYQFREQL